jgi:hypothetical protein
MFYLPVDPKTFADINLALQIVLFAAVLTAVYLARRKKRFLRHCRIMRVIVPLQVLDIVFVMLPSLTNHLENSTKGFSFDAELVAHHSLGLAVVALWVYVNLVSAGKLKSPGSLATPMRAALLLWTVTIAAGVHQYFVLWVL